MTPKRLRLIASIIRREMRHTSGHEIAMELEEHASRLEDFARAVPRPVSVITEIARMAGAKREA